MEIVNNPFKGEGAVVYKGETKKVKLTLNAFRMMTQKFGIGLDDFDKAFQADPLTTIGQLTYCGIVNASMAAGQKFEDDFETFCVYFFEDEAGITEMQNLLNAVNPTSESKDGESGND